MQWYYINHGNTLGPFTIEEMKALVHDGKVVSGTPVWNNRMTKWQTWASTRLSDETAVDNRSPGKTAHCTECGKEFLQENMVHFENAWICTQCKPAFFQKLKE